MAFSLDPNQCANGITLSNNNRTAASTVYSDSKIVFSDWSNDSGKIYFEFSIDLFGSYNGRFGFYNLNDSNISVDSQIGQYESWGFQFYFSNLRRYHNGGMVGQFASTYGQGDTLKLAINIDSGLIWLGLAGGAWLFGGDPATDSSPTWTDATIAGNSIGFALTPAVVNEQFTVSFRTAQCIDTVPTGYLTPEEARVPVIYEPVYNSQDIGLNESVVIHKLTSTKSIVSSISFTGSVGHDFTKTTYLIQDEFSLSESVSANIVKNVGINENIGLSSYAAETLLRKDISASFGLSAFASGGRFKEALTPVESIQFECLCSGFNYGKWLRENKDKAVTTYHLKITGKNDGLSDYEIKGLKSFQYSRSLDERNFLTCVLVYDEGLLSAILDRPNGQLCLDMIATVNGLNPLRESLIVVDYNNVRYDRGGASQSITITGYGEVTRSNNRFELTNVTVESMRNDGRLSYRIANPEFYLNPGDTAIHGPNEFTVNRVMAIVSTTNHYAEISE